MAIFRVEKTKDYTVMANHHLRNRNLSLKSKGLLSQILSLPENWDFTLKGLAMINRECIDSIRDAVRELEQAGYIARTRERNDKGQMKGTDYTIFERPQTDPDGTNTASMLEPPEWACSDPAGSASTQSVRSNLTAGNHTPESQVLEKPTLEKPILDNPVLGKPTQANPTQANPTLGKPTQLSTYPSSTDSSRKDPSSTESSSTDEWTSHPSYPSADPLHQSTRTSLPSTPTQHALRHPRTLFDSSLQDGLDEIGCETPSALRHTIQRNIEYDFIAPRHQREKLDEIVDIIVETLCSRRSLITVAGDDFPTALVKDKLLRLTSAHIEYVMECLSQSTTYIRNIRKYILAALFNAPSTIDSYYSAMVRHDRNHEANFR